mgnify:CR=1 FL=1
MSAFWDKEQEFYRSPEWRDLRNKCLRRDGHRCTYIAGGFRCEATENLEAHHVIPRTKGGADALYNLKTRCRRHHEVAHEDMRKKSTYKATFYAHGSGNGGKNKNATGKPRQTVFKYKPTIRSSSRRWS